MSTFERQAHWQNVYQTKDENAVSWFQERPDISLDLIHATGADTNASIIDVGGGASRLVDVLIGEGFNAVSVLDLSEKALATSKVRLAAQGGSNTMDRGGHHALAAISNLRRMARPRGTTFSYGTEGPCCIRRASTESRTCGWPRDNRYICAGRP